MTDTAFLRKYELKIGRNSELIERILPIPKYDNYVEVRKKIDTTAKVPSTFVLLDPNTTEGAYRDFVTTPAKSLTLTDLHFEAYIIDNNNVDMSSSQPTEIKIYNLSGESLSFIKTGNSVLLKAGYVQDKNLPLIFVGQISHMEHRKEGRNTITHLFCQPAVLANQVKVTRSYPPMTLLSEIIDDLVAIAASKGVPAGIISQDPLVTKSFPFGYYCQGNLLEVIEKLCNENGLRSYVTLGRLYIEPKYSQGQYVKVIRINEENVKESIEREADASDMRQTTAGTLEGISARLFLNGNITTGTLVKVMYGRYRGDYIARSVFHKMSYEAGDTWDTEVHCEKILDNASRS